MENTKLPLLEQIEEASEGFVVRWRDLISTTNWEKGRIIHQWREALKASGSAKSEFSDEAWSRRVGNVTPQHVGRLRRVHERFGDVQQDYPGLFWSHFQAALDFSDSEMWLEGAVQNSWSVGAMRIARWETLDGLEANRPDERDVVEAEVDEDFSPDDEEVDLRVVQDVARANDSDWDETDTANCVTAPSDPQQQKADLSLDEGELPSGELDPDVPPGGARPFADLPSYPEDLAEAFEACKLAIVRHRLDQWHSVSRRDVVRGIQALEQLALADS